MAPVACALGAVDDLDDEEEVEFVIEISDHRFWFSWSLSCQVWGCPEVGGVNQRLHCQCQ